jgi:methionine-rich copper-binding protein CopC
MKKLYILILGLLVISSAYGQIGKQWDKTFGGTGYEFITSTIATSDGGFLLAGYSNSGLSGDKTQASQGGYDFWVVRINSSGAKSWDKRFGGSGDDVLFSAIQTTDGGFLLGGYSNSAAGADKTQASQGSYDYWVVKIDANGAKQWDKRFGGSGDDYLTSVLQSSDGNYLLSGYSASPASGDKGFNLVGTSGFSDFWVVKINASNGNKIWDNASGTPYADQLLSVVEIDGGFLLGGYYPFGGDTENMDFILIEIEGTNGEFVESGDGYFGGDNIDYLTSIIKTADGGYLLAGYSNSIVSYDKTESPRGGYDYWVIKTDSGLEKEWNKTLGGDADDYLLSAVQTADGGFLLGGQSYSGATNERSEANRGEADFWIIKLNSTGIKQWDKRYGGTGLDALNEIVKTSDGFLLSGYSESGISGDKSQAVSGGANLGDFWAVKLIDAPVVTTLSPANGSTGVAVSSNLIMTFSESIQKGSGNITINQGATLLQTIAVSNAAVNVSGSTVTINPPSDLPAGTVNVQMQAGSFKDLANNNYAGITNVSTWAFTTAAVVDATPPTVTTFSPLDGAANVDISTNLSITFNESIQKGTGNILIKTGTTTLQTIDVTTDAVSVSGNTVTIDPPTDLSAGKAINIQIASGAFKDQPGNNYAGITNETTWNFTTIADNTDPSFVSPTPSVSNIGTTTLNIDVKLTETGKVYYVMVQDGTNATITPEQIKAGLFADGTSAKVKGNGSVTANTSVSLAVTALTPNLAYDIYLIAEDNNGNLQDVVTKIDIVTLPTDELAPTVTVFSPLNNATSIALDANLVITFSENVKAGTGSISVNAAGNTAQTLSVRDPGIVSIAGNVVTINPPNDLPLNKVIDIQMPAGVFTDNAGNKFAGILNATTWKFTTVALQITQNTLPNQLTSTGGTIANNSASITLNQFPTNSKVHFYSKSISREAWAKKENLVPSSGTTFTEALQDKNSDEIGLQYYFEIEPATGFGTKFTSAITTASIKYSDGLAIPPLLFGTEQKDYQIISIPLELTNKTTSNIFKALGTYNDTKWRLFSHLNSTDNFQENTKGLSSIEPGTGYWLIMKDNTEINTGEGATFRKNTDDPFTITLKPGWNLIGNPYNLDVSWTDVKAANSTLTGFGNLRVFENGAFKDSDVLKKFRGAYVRNESQADLVVKIPVKRNTTLNGNRIAAPMRYHEQSLFEVNFSLHSREVGYQLGGLGMHPEAKPDKDVLDDFVLPRFLKYLEMHFPRANEGKDKLTKDMVPVAGNHIWDFAVNTNLSNQPVTLSWENYLNHPAEKQLYLYDVERKIAINLLEQQSYTFLAKPVTAFKVYYGKPDFIRQHIQVIEAGAYSYPNPFSEMAILAFSLPVARTSYSLQMPVYNSLGQQVANLSPGIYSHGFHQISWNGKDALGNKLPAGVYTCQIQAVSGDNSKQYTIRMVIR